MTVTLASHGHPTDRLYGESSKNAFRVRPADLVLVECIIRGQEQKTRAIDGVGYVSGVGKIQRLIHSYSTTLFANTI